MEKFSGVIGGIIVSAVGAFLLPTLIGWGFSDGCGSEIVDKITPLIGMAPGAIWAWVSRFKMGGITKFGARLPE